MTGRRGREGATAAPPLDAAGFARAVPVSRETLARLEAYARLLVRWNRAINLVAPASLGDLWARHMLDSAQLLPLLPAAPEGRPRVLLDLGSGAGFPGMVLAILGAGEVHLAEADRRKASFLREVARETGTRVTLHCQRVEALAPFAADVVTARAFAPLPRLLPLAAPFLRPEMPGAAGGVALLLKGRRLQAELTAAAETWHMQYEAFPSRTESAAKILRLKLLDLENAGRDTTTS